MGSYLFMGRRDLLALAVLLFGGISDDNVFLCRDKQTVKSGCHIPLVSLHKPVSLHFKRRK